MTANDTVEETTIFTPAYNADGLLPCITVDASNGAVLMMAWMNDEAIRTTLETGVAHYWSRSRQTLWKKGETSGSVQHVVSASLDCDQDTLLLKVRPDNIGQTCHTGRKTCFYRTIVNDPEDPSGLRLVADTDPAEK